MGLIEVNSFANGKWIAPSKNATRIKSAITGDDVALCGHDGLDTSAMREFARRVGGPAGGDG